MSQILSMGASVRARRADLGLTLAQVAEASGLSVAYVSNIERGRGNPTVSALEALAGALKLPLATLFAAEDSPTVAGATRAGAGEFGETGVAKSARPTGGEVPSAESDGPAEVGVVAEWMRLTRDDLLAWVDTEGSDRYLPELVRNLIRETAPEGTRVDFPSGRGVLSGGWDGLVECFGPHAFVPMGLSGWEVSVEKNTKRKSDSDYANRCEEVPGPERAEMAYVQVICRPWTKAREFEATKTGSEDFRETRALNVDHLSAWLLHAPNTTMWLRDVMGKPVEGVEPLGAWWRRWLDSTHGRVDAGVVLAGREEAAEELRRLCGAGGTVTVGSEAPHDAIVAFVAAVLADTADGPEPLYVERLGEARRLLAAAGRRTNAAGSILVVESAEIADRLDPVPPRCVVVPVAGVQRADVVVGPVDAREVSERLRAHGIDHDKCWDLAYVGRRSMLALRRELAVKRELHLPRWAADTDSVLRRCLLLNRWDGAWTGDAEIVESFVGRTYSQVQERLEAFAGDDPPMQRFETVWHTVSATEAWIIAGRSLRDEELQDLADIAVEVLGEPDPLFGLDIMAHVRAAGEGVGPRYSERLKQGVAISLAVLATADEQVPAAARDVVRGAVTRLLELANNDASLQRWATIAPWLPLLAEAAPRAVLSAMRVSLADGAPMASSISSREHKDAFGYPRAIPTRHLMDALAVLAWSPEYFGEAAAMLAQLSELDADDGFRPTPTDVLSGIMCPWLPNTSVSADTRFAVLDMLRRQHPSVAWQVMLSMLPRDFGTTSSGATPRYRDWKDQRVPVTNAECFEAELRAGTALVADAASIEGGWAQLVDRCGDMWPDTRGELIDALKDVARSADEATRRSIWPTLRAVVADHRAFGDAKWALPASELEEFEALVGPLRPSSLAEVHRWLFDVSVLSLTGVSSDIDDRDTRDAAVAERRIQAVQEILTSGGLDAVIAFARSVTAPGLVGEALARSAPADLDAPVMGHLDGPAPAAMVAKGYFSTRYEAGGWTLFDELIANHSPSPAATAELLRASGDLEASWARVDTSAAEVATEYWQRFASWELGHEDRLALGAAQRLTTEGRLDAAAALLAGFDHALRDAPEYARAVIDVLEELAQQGGASLGGTELNHYSLRALMEVLNRHVDTLGAQRVAQIEWEYLPDLRRTAPTPNLHRALVDSPEFFARIVQAAYPNSEPSAHSTQPDAAKSRYRQSAARGLLRRWPRSPGLDASGAVDPEQLRDWVTRARHRIHDSDVSTAGDIAVGAALAAAPPDPDGSWPAIAVCDLIEEIASDDLDTGFTDAAIAARRGLSSGGGGCESEIAAEYRQTQQRLAARLHLRAAAICAQLADHYDVCAIMLNRRTTERELGLTS